MSLNMNNTTNNNVTTDDLCLDRDQLREFIINDKRYVFEWTSKFNQNYMYIYEVKSQFDGKNCQSA